MSKEIKIAKLLQALTAIKVYAWDNDKESLATWEKRYEQLTDDAIISDIWKEYCGRFGFRTEHDEYDIPDNQHLKSAIAGIGNKRRKCNEETHSH